MFEEKEKRIAEEVRVRLHALDMGAVRLPVIDGNSKALIGKAERVISR